jgi:hypothetical protein
MATCTSPLEAHAEFLLGLIAEQPDLTPDEVIATMKNRQPQRGLTVLRSTQQSASKNFLRDGAKVRRNCARMPTLDPKARVV